MKPTDDAPRARRTILLAGFLAAIAASLSIHVIMLQVLDVPYPGNLPANGWGRLPDRLMSTIGAVALAVLLPDRWRGRPAWQQAGLIFLLTGMIHETLLRLPIMNIAVASRWTILPFVDALPADLTLLAVAIAIVAVRRLLTSPGRCLIAALAIALAVYMVLAPLLKAAFAGVLAWTSPREGYSYYNPPYDWHVELPAYVTFAEPVIAAFLVAALVRGRLVRGRLRAGAVLALLLFALRGQFLSTFVNIRYAGTDPITAMLSFGQFTLESAALAIIVAATWVLAVPGARTSD